MRSFKFKFKFKKQEKQIPLPHGEFWSSDPRLLHLGGAQFHLERRSAASHDTRQNTISYAHSSCCAVGLFEVAGTSIIPPFKVHFCMDVGCGVWSPVGTCVRGSSHLLTLVLVTWAQTITFRAPFATARAGRGRAAIHRLSCFISHLFEARRVLGFPSFADSIVDLACIRWRCFICVQAHR